MHVATRRRAADRALCWVTAAPFVLLVGGLLGGGFGWLLVGSLRSPEGGDLSLAAWRQLVDVSLNRQAIAGSVLVGVTTATLATAVGMVAALLLGGGETSRRPWLLGSLNAGGHIGGAPLAFASLVLIGNAGVLRGLLVAHGLPQPPALVSFWGFVLVFTYSSVPIVVLLVMPAMSVVRFDIRDAAATLGLGRLAFARHVTWRILRPFAAGAWVFSFAWAIGQYTIVFALASSTMPADVITQRLGTLVLSSVAAPDRFQQASALAGVLVLLVLGAAALAAAVVARDRMWLSGAWLAPDLQVAAGRTRSGLRRSLTAAAVATYLAAPIVISLLYSLSTSWRGGVLPDGYTLTAWRSVLADDRFRSAVVRSFVLATAAAMTAVALVAPPLLVGHIRRPALRQLVRRLCVLPLVLPTLVIGLELQRLTADVPAVRSLGQSWRLLFLGHVCIAIPFVVWAVDGALASAGVVDLVETASSLGIDRARTAARVVLPLVRIGLVTGALLGFADSFGEFAMAKLITGPVYETLPFWQVSRLRETSGDANAAAVAAVVSASVLLVVSAASTWVGSTRRPGRAGRRAAA